MVGRIILFAVVLSLIGIDNGDIGSGKAYSPESVEVVYYQNSDGDIAFTENKGQWDEEVLFRCDWRSGSSWFTRNGVTHLISEGDRTATARIDFVNGARSEPVGTEDLGYDSNYFRGDISVRGARSYSAIIYEGIWSDIDIVYRSERGSLKYDIIVGEWADPDQILFEVSGHRTLIKEEDGLDISLAHGIDLIDADLISFDDSYRPVRSEFRIVDDNIYGFEVDKEPGTSIVIDPMVYSSYLGGCEDDDAEVLIDDGGYLYVLGSTNSPDMPIVGGVQSFLNKRYDVFVTKMVPNGSSIVFSTYLGGTNMEFLTGCVLDQNGAIFLTGTTNSIDYPTTSGAYQEGNENTMYNDIFITKLNGSGDRLLYSTYISGDWYETSTDIALVDGCAAICGIMESHNFPTENGRTGGGVHGTAFFLLLNASGSGILDSCFWDTGGSERAEAMEVDMNGDVIIGGTAGDPTFPVTPGAYTNGFQNMTVPDMFIMRYRPSEGYTVFSSLIGGRSYDYLTDLCIDPSGDILFCGRTNGWGKSHFPITNGSFDGTLNGTVDGVVGKLSGDGSSLLFSTLLGGDSEDSVNAIDTDDEGCAYLTGSSKSSSGLTVTKGCLDPSFNGIEDAFAARLSSDGSSLQYLTYLGGTEEDLGNRIIFAPERDLIVSGYTMSIDFPVSNGSYQSSNKGSSDAFFTIIEVLTPPGPPQNLTAVSGDSVIHLAWERPSNDGGSNISGYMLYRGYSLDNWSLISEVNDSLSYSDRSLTIGVTYYYAVSCRNVIGESALSDEAMNVSITLPSPPSSVFASTFKDFIAITWSAPVFTGGCDILSFEVFRGQDENVSLVSRLDPTKCSYIDPDVEDCEVYEYSITALNKLGPSKPSNVSARMSGPPTPPRNLTYTYSDRLITLSWEGPEDNMELPLSLFNIYRWVDDGDPVLFKVLSPVSDMYEDRSVENGKTFHYSLTAENSKGESGRSNVIHAIPRTVPSPPSEVKGAWSGSGVVLTWSKPMDDGGAPILGYDINFATMGGEYTWIGSIPPTEGLRFIHSIPLDDMTRYYYVTTFNSEGISLPSNTVSLEPLSPPGSPRNIKARALDGASTIEWSAPETDGGSAILGYKVYRSNASADKMVCVATVWNDTLRLDDERLTNGVSYHYSISSFNVVGEGERSEAVLVVPTMTLGPVQAFIGSSHHGRIELSWDPPANDGSLHVTGYHVYRSSQEGEPGLEKIANTSTTGFVDQYVTKAMTYSYHITPFTDRTEGPLSPVVQVKCLDIPDRPAAIWADLMGDRVSVRWSVPSNDGGTGVTHYIVQRFSSSIDPDFVINTYSLEFVDTNLAQGSAYTYQVIAVNSEGESLPVETIVHVPSDDRRDKEKGGFDWIYIAIPVLILIVCVLCVIFWRSSRKDIWEE